MSHTRRTRTTTAPTASLSRSTTARVDSSAATVSITVNPVNDAPSCSAVSLTTDEDTPGDANPDCTDIDSASLTYAIVGAASHGTASILAGKLHYIPNANYNGSDSFTYKANDGALDSNTATVSVTVNPVNDAPVASAQSATTAEDTSKTVTLTRHRRRWRLARLQGHEPARQRQALQGTDTTGHLIAAGELPYLVSAADKVTFDPNLNYNGSDSFNFKAYDGALDSAAAAAVSITVTEVNDAPDAVDDSASVAEDGNTLVDVLGNDSTGPANESGQALTITDVSTPAHGTAVVQSGKVKYTPNADYNGSDSFTYTATDDGTTNGVADPKSDTATVSVTVTEVNDAPTAVADSKTIAEDGTLSFPASDLTANDSAGPANESGQTLTVISVDPITGQTHGSVSLVAGTITYTPDPDFNGLAKFDYTVQDNGTTDGAPDFKTGTVYVNVTVTEVNDAPTATDDSKTVAEDGTLSFPASDLTANDSAGPANESGQTLTVTAVGSATHGSVSLVAGTITYTPDADFNGPASFHYTVRDNGTTNGAADPLEDEGTVDVTVTEVNDAPTAVADSKTIAEDGTLSFPASDLTANDSAGPANESGQTLTVISVDPITGQTHGSVSLVAGTITYTPDPDFNGLAKFDYTVQDNGTTDGAPDFKTGTVYVNVTVTEVNDAPTATDDSKTVAEDGTLSFPASDLTANDSAGPANESGQTLTVTAVGSATHGSVSLVAGTITYTPDADYNGPASFHYTVRDNGTTNGAADPLEDEGTVDVTVTEVNDAPDAANDSASVAEDSSTGTLVDVLANDSVGPANESSQSLMITAVGTPAHGTAAVESGKIRYIPTEADYNGSDSFTYTVTDNGTTGGEDDFKSDTATVSVTVTEVNDDPTAVDDSASVAEDGNVLVDVLGNDSTGPANESGQTLTISAVGSPAHGTAVVQSGKVKYTPNADYNGSDSFTYTATDNGTSNGVNDFKSDTATVSVTVTEVNDRPVAAADSLTVAEDGSVTVGTATLTANDSPGPANESGQTLTITAVGSATHGNVSLNGMTGEVTFTPDADYNGPASFTYTVRDNGTTNGSADYKTDTGTVNVTVTEVNDAPHAVNDSASVAEDSSTGVLVDVLANDGKGAANESGQTLTITFVGTPSHGTAMLESGKIRYTPTESNYNGPDSFGYTITDNGTTNGVADPKSDSAMVNITVTPVNDKPSVARNNASVTVNEGQTASNSGTYSDVDGDNVGISASVGTVTKTGVDNGTWSWSFNTTDGPAQSQTVTITANDGHGGMDTTTFALTVNNVKPTITNVTATNTYAGPLAFMTSAISTFFTDPGADAPWANLLTFSDGGTESGSGNASPITLTHRFTTPGCKTVTSKITDKDGAFDTFGPTPVNVGTGEFLPPVTNTPVTNKLKNGQVLPVKVKLTDCNGVPVTGLNPAIALKKGDLTSVGDDSVVAITPGSVSNADTTGIMRSSGDGSYIYNMSVNITLNTDYTLIVYPFGTGSPTQYLAHVIQATK